MPEERLLVYLKSYLGDAVMVSPMLQWLQGRCPNLTILTAPFVNPVLWVPNQQATFKPAPKGRTPWAVVRNALEIRRGRFDTAVVVNRSFRTALIVRLSGVPRRIGHRNEGRDRLLTEVIPFSETEFEAKSCLDLARPLGLENVDYRPRLHLTTTEKERGQELALHGRVGFQPGARFPKKQLPIQVQTSLARAVQDQGLDLVFLGGKEEEADADRLASALDRPVINLVGKTSIRETLGVLSNLQTMVGADTGVMHLAVGVGCPTVSVFGPTVAEKWGHDYDPHHIVRAPERSMAKVQAESILIPLNEILNSPRG